MEEEKFEVVVHHSGSFCEPGHLGYYGCESTWICHHDVWSYLGVLSGLKDMGYNDLESLWFYDPEEVNEVIRLNSDIGTKRMKLIAYSEGRAHLCVLHTLAEPIVEEYPTLECFVKDPDVVRSNVANGNGIVNVGRKESGPSNVVDNGPTIEVDKENGPSNVGGASFNENEGVVDKESENVGPTLNVVDSDCDSAFGITFNEPEEEDVGFDDYFGEAPGQPKPFPNNEPTVPSQTHSSIVPNADNSQPQTSVQTDTNADPTQTDTNLQPQPAQPKKKRGRQKKRPITQTERTEPVAEPVPKPPQFGLSDIEECNSEDLDSDCESDDGKSKKKFPTFKLLESMFEYKWEVGTYFVSKREFQEGMRTYAVHNGKDLKFTKSDKIRVIVICKKDGCPWKA